MWVGCHAQEWGQAIISAEGKNVGETRYKSRKISVSNFSFEAPAKGERSGSNYHCSKGNLISLLWILIILTFILNKVFPYSGATKPSEV